MSEPSRALCALVDKRDGGFCVRCGVSLSVVRGARHHRLKRREGGHSASILVLLCEPCHLWAHGHPRAARAVGLIIPAAGRVRPRDVPSIPLRTWAGWAQHDDAGERVLIQEALALELLAAFGMVAA